MLYSLPSLSPYATIRKAHGHQGEVTVSLEDEAYWELDPTHLFILVDHIPVPFEVVNIRGDASRLILKLSQIRTDKEADKYKGQQLLVDSALLASVKRETSNDRALIGIEVYHPEAGFIGTIMDIDTSTPNVLLLLKTKEEEKEIYLPLVDEWILDFAPDDKGTLLYNCPKGLLIL